MAQTDAGPIVYSNPKMKAAFDLVNAERTAAGLGVVRQAAALDAAADVQSNYLGLNNDLDAGVTQDPSRNAFTAATTAARLATAGYAGSARETAVSFQRGAVEGVGALLAAPYQRLALLQHGALEMGLGYVEPGATRPVGAAPVVANPVFATLVATAGVRTSAAPQGLRNNALDASSVYPPAGAEVPTIMFKEVPNPVAAEVGPWGRGAFPGYPVSVQVLDNQTLTVALFTLTRVTPAPGVAVSVKLLDQNDSTFFKPNNVKNWATLVPLLPLEVGATYEATFAGTAGAFNIARVWQFTTRSGFGGAPTVQREVGARSFTVTYKPPSGLLDQASIPPSTLGCGAGYSVTPRVGLQTVTLVESGTSPLAGCAIELSVIDLGTGLSDLSRRITVP